MGYDCYVRSPREPKPEWPESLTSEALETYRIARDEWEERTYGYFRRSLSGGARLADALVAMGMGFDAEDFVPVPPWPDKDEYGVEFAEWKDEAGAWQDGYRGDRAQEYEAEGNRVLDWHGPEIPGIPIHKVCTSNDGWHVTREECRAALKLYESAIRDGKEHPTEFDDDFMPFLQSAAEADGFEVH